MAERIEVAVEGRVADGIAFLPEGAGPSPLVVFFMDAGGLRPALTHMGERLAATGYVVVQPNLYWRSGPLAPFDFATVWTDPRERQRIFALMNGFTLAQAKVGIDKLGVLSYDLGMTPKNPNPFDEDSEPLASRIATGLHKIGLAMKQQAWQQANDEGLSATQGQILAALVAHGPLTGSELSVRLGVTLPTISDSARVLADKKLVTKSPDPRHPRASLLRPTKRGAALGARARSWPEFMAASLVDLTAEEQRAFFSGVVKMIHALQQQGLIPLGGMCVTCTHFRPNVREGASPHHCAFVDAPLASEQLRVECAEHELAAEGTRAALWARFIRPG